MGNCYSAESNSNIETTLQNTEIVRRKADFRSADQLAGSDTIDVEAQEAIILQETASKLRGFISGLTASEYYN